MPDFGVVDIVSPGLCATSRQVASDLLSFCHCSDSCDLAGISTSPDGSTTVRHRSPRLPILTNHLPLHFHPYLQLLLQYSP